MSGALPVLVGSLAAALSLVPSAAVALQHSAPAQGRGSERLLTYDVTSEVTVTGTVHDVTLASDRSSRTSPSVQLTLITDARVIDVRLGPSTFLATMNIRIAKGERVEVTGSEVKAETSPTLLARMIRNENTVWSLRDEGGQPLWAASPTERRGFWSFNRIILLAALAGKVAAAVLLMG